MARIRATEALLRSPAGRLSAIGNFRWAMPISAGCSTCWTGTKRRQASRPDAGTKGRQAEPKPWSPRQGSPAKPACHLQGAGALHRPALRRTARKAEAPRRCCRLGLAASSDKRIRSSGMIAAAMLQTSLHSPACRRALDSRFSGFPGQAKAFCRILERKMRTFACVLHFFC